MTSNDIIRMAREATSPEWWEQIGPVIERFAHAAFAAGAAAEREECAKVCDELAEHFADYKDTALLNGNVKLSNAASGESRAARAIAEVIRARK